MLTIRTPADLGAVIRERRRRLRLDQHELAQRVGVGRHWIVEIEKGKGGAELGLVLRTLDALGIPLTVADQTSTAPQDDVPGVDIDAIVKAARGKRS
jgi:HTH-type transcriptional regulator / antitoxin HipB